MEYLKRFARIWLVVAIGAATSFSCSKESEPDPEVTLSDRNVILTQTSGQKQVQITADRDWTLSVVGNGNDPWCDVSPLQGESGTTDITIVVGENNTDQERSAQLHIRCGSLTKVLKITQSEVYISTDFSQNGTWYTYQKASGEKGVDVYFLGDGFSDRDVVEDGRYDQIMARGIEALFAEEPYTTYRSLFNVYVIRVVSGQNKIPVGNLKNTALGCYFRSAADRIMDMNRQAVYQYVQRVRDNADFDNVMLSVVANSSRYGGTSYWYYDGGGPAIGISSLDAGFEGTIQHEVGGHVIGKLADEYTSSGGTSSLTEGWKYGRYLNVDVTNDLSKIKWSHFINLPGYEMVGAYEGGFYATTGIWRPEENSKMKTNAYPFNAPSRELIVKRIFEIVGKPYYFSEFLANDKIPQASRVQTRAFMEELPPLPPPVVLPGSWKDDLGN